MNANDHITITKANPLPQSQDYYFLRSEGIRLIEKLGSKLWTDYNIHDPGITILEVLCYAITDLSYRSSYDVKDLIAEEKPEWFNAEMQTLFTAREILTTAPWTIYDYRKLLIDLESIRNAWVKCSKCNCGPKIYVDCKKSELTYAPPLPPEDPKEHEVIPKGLYDILLELDEDEKNGDLNTGKIALAYNKLIDGDAVTLYLEVRFPSRQALNTLQETNSLIRLFRDEKSVVTAVNAQVISNKKNALVDIAPGDVVGALRGGLYVTYQITFDEFVTTPGLATAQLLTFKDVPFRFVLLKNDVRRKLVLNDLRAILEDDSSVGTAARYLNKIQAADRAVALATNALQRHRNVTEDFCCIDEVEIEEIGVCADIELKPDADIEQVLSEAFYLISEYFNPTIRFHALSDLEGKLTTDQIFNGPKLMHGFIDDADLERTALNRTLYASDIINQLMDIPGVVNIKNFALVRFDSEGNNVAAYPWKLELKPDHLPRFYLEGSKLLVFKNGLPFTPDIAELMDTMLVVRGRNLMPKLQDHDLDIEVPLGEYYPMQEYYPVQKSLPQVYGTGYEGLPSTATAQRKAQAKQLKSYLVFFEQLLVNYMGQLANIKHLFSLDNSITKTYFPVLVGDEYLASDIYPPPFDALTSFYHNFDAATLQEITESHDTFLDRRNRFLDHLMSRFSESFADYALLLHSYKDQTVTPREKLIPLKTSFLKQFPYQSAYKAQSFDYTDPQDIETQKDLGGLHQRIRALLGMQASLNYFDYNIVKSEAGYSTQLSLKNEHHDTVLTSTVAFQYEDRDDLIRAINLTMALIVKYSRDKTKYTIQPSGAKFKVTLGSPVLAEHTVEFDTSPDADGYIDALVAFAEQFLTDEKLIIVEHILLRPQAEGDPLLPVCVDSDCTFCGEEDPYSYKVTFALDGEAPLPRENFDYRRFAEKTMRAELPAHVLAKVCWVEHDVFEALDQAYADWLTATPANKPVALAALINVFKDLKSIYPPPTLHDCIDGNDENRVFLNQTQL